MSFGETGHSDSESARVRMCARFIEPSNELYQVDGVLERVPHLVIRNVMRPIASEREDVPDRRLGVSEPKCLRSLFRYDKRRSGEGLDPVWSCVEFARPDYGLSLALSRRPHTSR